jgi:hypothetical protein
MKIEDPEASSHLAQIVELTGELPLDAVRAALQERLLRLQREAAAKEKARPRDESDLWGY